MKRNDFDFSARRRFTLAQRFRLLARYQRRGLTQRAFVPQHGLSLTALTQGLRQDRPNQAAVPTGKVLPEFQPVALSRRLGPPGWAAEVALPDGSPLRSRQRHARRATAANSAPPRLNCTSATRAFGATAPVAWRGSFNKLFARTPSVWPQDPRAGPWLVFAHRRRHRIKLLFRDGAGLWVCAQRLEKGRCTWPAGEGASSPLPGEELSARLAGLAVQVKAKGFRR